ncbi:hypothetical protein ACRRTK_019137 [Alexandromys fortis]
MQAWVVLRWRCKPTGCQMRTCPIDGAFRLSLDGWRKRSLVRKTGPSRRAPSL